MLDRPLPSAGGDGYPSGMTREAYRKRLSGARVGIAGCGGLGSNCAAALARAGVGRLVLADFDTVSEANLDRQFFFRDQVGRPKAECLAENLRRIDPSLGIEATVRRLDPEGIVTLFGGCDVIVEAFDAADQKAMIIETVLSRLKGTWLVAASGLAGYGRDSALGLHVSGSLVLCGDLESEVGADLPPMAPRVGIVANMEADAVVSILLDGRIGEST